MRQFTHLIAAVAGAACLAGCMHHGTQAALAGDVVVDSLTATRTAILRIQNDYPSEVRVYTVLDGQSNYVAKAMPNQTRTSVMDPNLFPATSISFEARAADGSARQRIGPFKLDKGQTIEIVVPADMARTRAMIHQSTP
ncbi:MAG TPA: hypothetical protein VN600_11070 [Gemmatimonadaceae bacterium]|nr:hypothetical protein [Gemmatimonadaceae bacterium]